MGYTLSHDQVLGKSINWSLIRYVGLSDGDFKIIRALSHAVKGCPSTRLMGYLIQKQKVVNDAGTELSDLASALLL